MPVDAVELRLGEICRRLPQDLIRLAQFAHFTCQRLEPTGGLGRNASSLARAFSALNESSEIPKMVVI